MARTRIEPALLGLVRPGFEPELAAEFGHRAAEAGHWGHAMTERGSGLVRFVSPEAAALDAALPFDGLIFARQKLLGLARLEGLDPGDRISPLLEALDTVRETGAAAPGGAHFGELVVEHSDSDAGRALAGLARGFGNALRPALRKAGWLAAADDARRPRLHVLLHSGTALDLASSRPGDRSPWPGGIPRLRQPPHAPSRSAAKLDEAIHTLLTAEERTQLLREGMRAADLGAAPGGWTWVLVRAGLRVSAVDNGPLKEPVLGHPQVEHLRADGFRWQPARPLDWMVCDMVEQPRRVAGRMAQWFREGWCRNAVFNLKLPMKKRWEETRYCLDLFRAEAGELKALRARQLYHDREEITVFARR
ncbi:MAG: 23S rRNA (cytidine(2498)-2'-O)-methyltransferase RlmM [Silanimonas lenta]